MKKIENQALTPESELLSLAWPFFASQFVLLCSGLSDVVMTGNYDTESLAAIGIGISFWGTLFAAFSGVIQGLGPIVGRKFGEDEHSGIGNIIHASAILAILLSLPGILLLTLSAGEFFRLSQVPQSVADRATEYVSIVAFSLPAALLARVFFSFTASVRRPQAIFSITCCALLVKIPVTYGFLHGTAGLPELGLDGCAIGTVSMFLVMAMLSILKFARDPFYLRFRISRPFSACDWQACRHVFSLGWPIGMSQLLEIGSLTVMAFIVARLGAQTTAAHQILASVAGLMFMMPMAIGMALQTLVANARGRRDFFAAKSVTRAALKLTLIWLLTACSLLYAARELIIGAYTQDSDVAAIALAVFPVLITYLAFDAIQIVVASALRGYEETLLPSIIYLVSLWGIGVTGGYLLTYRLKNEIFWIPGFATGGASGVWTGGATSLFICALALNLLLIKRSRHNLNCA